MPKPYWPGRTLAMIYGDVDEERAEGSSDGQSDTAVTSAAPRPENHSVVAKKTT